MRTGTSRNVAIIVLIIIAIVLIGAAVFVGIKLSQSGYPPSTGATGFGANVNKANFTLVDSAFSSQECSYFFKYSDYSLVSEPEIKVLTADYTGFANVTSDNTNYSKNCKYNFTNNRNLSLSITPYNKDSAIDATADALYLRVNKNLASTLVEGKVNTNIKYFFGKDATAASCRLNIFHTQNEFESATVLFNGFTTNCASIAKLAAGLAEVFSYPITQVMLPFLIPGTGTGI